MPRLAAPLTVATALTLLATASVPALAREGNDRPRGNLEPMTVGIVADSPYGEQQAASFDLLVQEINADPEVDVVAHIGDIKSGGTVCSDDYFGFIRTSFADFVDPLYYVPGDNEWTDCHRDSNGDYVPTERLELIRDLFFAKPGHSLSSGRHAAVRTQAAQGPPENQTWYESGVQIGMVHIVGSNNDLEPWELGPDDHDLPQVRLAEVAARTDAAVDWIDTVFDGAQKKDAAGVLLLWHADMWSAFDFSNGADMSGFQPIVERLAERAEEFDGPILIVNGDSHDFYEWKPLSDSDTHPLAPFYATDDIDLAEFTSTDYYGVGGDIDNLRQVTVEIWDAFAPEPSDLGPEDLGWMKVHVDPRSPEIFVVEQKVLDLPG